MIRMILIEIYNPHKKRKILIAFDDMITDMPSNKSLNQQSLNYISAAEN